MLVKKINLPKFIAHRGASADAPENTLAAFNVAVDRGAQWVEFDVRLTRDQALVLCHDERFDRTTNGKGLVRNYTLEQANALDAGSWFSVNFIGERVPSFKAILDFLSAHHLSANIEMKSSVEDCELIANKTIAMLKKSGLKLDKFLISSFETDSLVYARRLSNNINIGLLFDELPTNWLELASLTKPFSVHLDQEYLTQSIVDEITVAGYAVLAYTVNNRARANELFEMGVSAIFSDVLF